MDLRVKAIIHSLAGLAVIGAATFVGSRWIPVNATTIGFAYLLIVLAIATAWGLVEAVAASIAAMLCFNYFFLPPVGQFTIADSQNWVALIAFLVTALVASHLSDRVKKQAFEARTHQRETEQLYALSRAILLTVTTKDAGSAVAKHIAEIFDCPAVALYEAKTGEVFRGGAEDLPEITEPLKQAVRMGSSAEDPKTGVRIAAILLGGHGIGSVALKGLALSDGALQALLNLTAIALERVHSEEAANRAEAARQSEEFKSTLLDAIAHEFKTPLTSIKAASTALLADQLPMSPHQREMTAIIDEETDRMSHMVTEAVRMAQIDAGKVRLHKQTVDLNELTERVSAQFPVPADEHRLRLKLASRIPPVSADPDLMSLALRQLIDNGLKYSAPGTPLDISTRQENHHVAVSVRDFGPGIAPQDREKVFEKFQRLQSGTEGVPGTGMGLYVAREIVRNHGGELWIVQPEGPGTEFVLQLPALAGTANSHGAKAAKE